MSKPKPKPTRMDVINKFEELLKLMEEYSPLIDPTILEAVFDKTI